MKLLHWNRTEKIILFRRLAILTGVVAFVFIFLGLFSLLIIENATLSIILSSMFFALAGLEGFSTMLIYSSSLELRIKELEEEKTT